VVNTLAIDCYNAAFSEMNDYEDALMTETSKRLNVDGIVTRNLKDHKLSCVKAFSPDEFLNYLSNADDIIAHKTAMQDYTSGETTSQELKGAKSMTKKYILVGVNIPGGV